MNALAEIWNVPRGALSKLPLWERGFVIFWLLGPFIMLVERTPADAWLTILAIAFVVRSIALRDWEWLKHFWVRAGFVFWFWCIATAAVSAHPAYAIGEAVIWFRFPLFAMATAFWLGRDRILLMLVATGLGLALMCDILLAELIIEGQKDGRLTWPYDDLVPGGYVAKVGLPVFAVLCAVAVGMKDRLALIAAALALVTVFVAMMTGERIHFLIVICGGALAALAWRPLAFRVIGLGGAGVAVIALGAWLTGTTRFGGDLVRGATDFETSVWWHTLNGGWVVAKDNLLTGIGTANYRLDAPVLLHGIPFTKIDPHPHNFYLQMLVETGVIGLVLGTVFLWSIIATCWRARKNAPDNILTATAFVVPFAFFWPVATTGDFFGQWNNCFMWSGIALAVALCTGRQAPAGAQFDNSGGNTHTSPPQ